MGLEENDNGKEEPRRRRGVVGVPLRSQRKRHRGDGRVPAGGQAAQRGERQGRCRGRERESRAGKGWLISLFLETGFLPARHDVVWYLSHRVEQ